MVVIAKGNGREVTGLRVGAANARRYFSRELDNVELRMGDLRIECRLSPEFWSTRPEIHDPRLCEWLKFKAAQHRLNRKPIALAMEQTGANSFSLHPLSGAHRGTRVAAA
jgi:hypothetical protein